MMTSEEFKQVRQLIWKTQAEAAAALGVTIATIKNYEHGRRKVPRIVAKLIKCLNREEERGRDN